MFQTLKEKVNSNSLSEDDVIDTFQATSDGIANECPNCKNEPVLNEIVETTRRIAADLEEKTGTPSFKGAALNGAEETIRLFNSLTRHFYTNLEIDGGWSSWSPWTCRTCVEVGRGQGTCPVKRTRSCNNPTPSTNGRKCFGNNEETYTPPFQGFMGDIQRRCQGLVDLNLN